MYSHETNHETFVQKYTTYNIAFNYKKKKKIKTWKIIFTVKFWREAIFKMPKYVYIFLKGSFYFVHTRNLNCNGIFITKAFSIYKSLLLNY